MKLATEKSLQKKIRRLILLFMTGLVVSGLTAFPLQAELSLLVRLEPYVFSEVQGWLEQVYEGLRLTNARFPFLAYGTDWLAFAHLVIAVAFIGPLRDPVRNIWVIEFGLIACGLVLPMALLAGPLRQIPLFWQLLDCSFGAIGFLPLWLCHRKIRQLQLVRYRERERILRQVRRASPILA